MPRYKTNWSYENVKKTPGILMNLPSDELMLAIKEYPEFSKDLTQISELPLNNFLNVDQMLYLVARFPSVLSDIDVTMLPQKIVNGIIRERPELESKIKQQMEKNNNR
jgi:hypothetical protein